LGKVAPNDPMRTARCVHCMHRTVKPNRGHSVHLWQTDTAYIGNSSLHLMHSMQPRNTEQLEICQMKHFVHLYVTGIGEVLVWSCSAAVVLYCWCVCSILCCYHRSLTVHCSFYCCLRVFIAVERSGMYFFKVWLSFSVFINLFASVP